MGNTPHFGHKKIGANGKIAATFGGAVPDHRVVVVIVKLGNFLPPTIENTDVIGTEFRKVDILDHPKVVFPIAIGAERVEKAETAVFRISRSHDGLAGISAVVGHDGKGINSGGQPID